MVARPPGQANDGIYTSKPLGTTSHVERFPLIDDKALDTVQKACLRLIDEHDGSVSTPRFNSGTEGEGQIKITLERLFDVELEFAERNADSRNARYWWTALKALQKNYPLCILAQNDTRIIRPILLASRQSYHRLRQEIQAVETSLRYLEDVNDKVTATTSNIWGRLDRLRDKMWYLADITNSNVYEVTKNVAQALRNMASPGSMLNQSSSASIRGRKKPRSLVESLIQEPEAQTISIMKAPLEQGGPKKLADEQVDMTRRWLQRYGVDNFCKGEERIHRFCMEIRSAASKLVGESMLESPVLWSSELYFRQRNFVDTLVTRSVPTSSVTRPSSILSEEAPTTYTQTHPSLRGFESATRPQFFDSQSSPGRKSSFHSLGSERWRTPRDFHSGDVISIADSPGRAVSATTADSINSFWSPLPTQPQSAASVSSLPSRPPSFINDISSPKLVDQNSPRRVKFLEELRQRVISLLLSDLGSPVWSCGSETDTWLAEMLRQPPVRWHLQKRQSIEGLLGDEKARSTRRGPVVPIIKRSSKSRRSNSIGPFIAPTSGSGSNSSMSTGKSAIELDNPVTLGGLPQEFPYQTAYEDLMERFSKQADPILKLDILQDLKSLVISSMHEKREHIRKSSKDRSKPPTRLPIKSAPASRRSSLNTATASGSATPPKHHSDDSKTVEADLLQHSEAPVDDKEVVEKIKVVLTTTRPKTLFRDLQFITAFVPSETLNKTPGGKAFLHVGLAALAFKDDVCRSLVSVAHKIMVNDGVKRRAPPPGTLDYTLRDAAQMWILAAKEGNATAQRELATLYLTHPELLPSVSLPLVAPRDIFKSEMKYWPEDAAKRLSSQALCLALHWMQLAASNGDAIAKKRLEEREARDSLR